VKKIFKFVFSMRETTGNVLIR